MKSCIILIIGILQGFSLGRELKPPIGSQIYFPKDASKQIENHQILTSSYQGSVRVLFDLSRRLQKVIMENKKEDNFLLSPLSIASEVGQILLGSRGKTKEILEEILGIGNKTKNSFNTDTQFHSKIGDLYQDLQQKDHHCENCTHVLQTSGAFFVDHGVEMNKTFYVSLLKYYGCQIIPVNFSGDPKLAQSVVNQWASDQTNGRISSILSSPLSSQGAAVLASTVYLKAEWENPFDEEITHSGKFRYNSTHNVMVNYMRTNFDMAYSRSTKSLCQMIRLPYKDGETSMYIILPDRNVNKTIHEYASEFEMEDFDNLLKNSELVPVILDLPKMLLEEELNIKDALLKIYKNSAFDCEQKLSARNKRNLFNIHAVPYVPKLDANITEEILKQTTFNDSSDLINLSDRLSAVNNLEVKDNCELDAEGGDFDLQYASPNTNFKINEIIHRIYLNVSEKGTEAAAITTGIINYSLDFEFFRVSRPFLVFIRHDKSGAILYFGAIVDPTSGTGKKVKVDKINIL